jgi:hypothetical protein
MAALLMIASGAPRALSQEPSGAVRGVVRSSSGEAVPYALVSLAPGYGQRFTDDSGRFAFTTVPSGTYRLTARQVGFRPFTTTLTVSDSAVTLPVRLEPLVVQVEEITVTAPRRCTAPGPPDPSLNPVLALVFDQLRENAHRYWLLADSYPAVYRMVRTFRDVDSPDYVRPTSSDTLELRTDARWRYAPGHVVAEAPAPAGGSELRVSLPTLPDLADSAFHDTHCFYLAGMDTVDGSRLVRIDFLADERLRTPDVNGTAWLDSASYLVRQTAIRLTRPQRIDSRLEDLTARASFREILPGILLVDRISAVHAWRTNAVSWVRRRSEEQHLVSVHFVRPLPTGR